MAGTEHADRSFRLKRSRGPGCEYVLIGRLSVQKTDILKIGIEFDK